MYKGTQAVVTTGILAAIAILLGVTRWGFTPPLILGVEATVMHVPVIIAAIVSGWASGSMVGLIFGIYSFLWAGDNPMFRDPLVSILPRALIGITTYLTYVGLRRLDERVAVASAAVIGTLTNTTGVLGMIVLRGYLPPAAALAIGAPYGLVESILAAVLAVAVVEALRATRGRRVRKANL